MQARARKHASFSFNGAKRIRFSPLARERPRRPTRPLERDSSRARGRPSGARRETSPTNHHPLGRHEPMTTPGRGTPPARTRTKRIRASPSSAVHAPAAARLGAEKDGRSFGPDGTRGRARVWRRPGRGGRRAAAVARGHSLCRWGPVRSPFPVCPARRRSRFSISFDRFLSFFRWGYARPVWRGFVCMHVVDRATGAAGRGVVIAFDTTGLQAYFPFLSCVCPTPSLLVLALDQRNFADRPGEVEFQFFPPPPPPPPPRTASVCRSTCGWYSGSPVCPPTTYLATGFPIITISTEEEIEALEMMMIIIVH
jgi:hypothetical protein